MAFRATLKGDGEQKEAVVEELTLDCHLDSERGLLCKHDFLLGTKLHVVTAEVKERKLKSLSSVRLFATPWTIQSMEFSRPEYWSA